MGTGSATNSLPAKEHSTSKALLSRAADLKSKSKVLNLYLREEAKPLEQQIPAEGEEPSLQWKQRKR